MAKLTKKVIKSIVKECLVEILSEGIGQSHLMESSYSEQKKSQNRSLINGVDERKKSAYRRRMGLDKIEFGKKEPDEVKNSDFEKNVKGAASSMTDDPVLSSILADTAQTTLMEQKVGEGKGNNYVPVDAAQKMVYESNLEDLFEGSQNWASLAFSDGKK